MILKKKLLAIIACSAVASCSLLGGVIALADNTVDIFAESYVKGQTLSIPKTVSVAGSTYSIKDSIVYSPDGKQYQESEVMLRQMGLYSVEYTLVDGSKERKQTETFACASDLYSISGKGTYEWKANEKTPNTHGLNVELGQGSSFVYNKIIDLNTISGDDNLVNLYVVPEVIGIPDFYSITITMTDIYDSTNKVMISGQNVSDGYYNGNFEYEYAKYTCYFKGGSTNQPMSGWQGNSLHVSNTYGYSSTCSFCGLGASGKSMDTDRFTVSFDYQERRVLKDGNYVIDLDNPNDFTEMWNGFTTGEVLLSISLSGAGTIVITDIANDHLDSEMLFMDDQAPIITVDYEGYENNIPGGMLGMPYTLFDATAKDSYAGEIDVVKKVYYDYNGEKEEIALKDGAFTPLQGGTYTVEYTATDWCGNVGVETFDVVVNAAGRPITASIVSSSKVTSGLTGDLIPLANIKLSGGYGELSTSINVYDANNQEVAQRKGGFVPLSVGEYTVVYTITDYIGQVKTLKYTVSVAVRNEPVIVDDVVLPKYVMNGKQYELPILNGYVFSSGSGVEAKADIWVRDSGALRKLDSNIYVPNVTANGTDVEVFYKLQRNGKECVKSYVMKGYVTTKSNGAMDMKSYFVTNGNITATEEKDKLTYATSTAGDSISFINPILAEGFSLQFSLGNMASAQALTFTLTDYENRDLKAVAVIEKTGNTSCRLVLNGTQSYDLKGIYFGNSNKYSLEFNNIFSQFGISDGSSTSWFALDGVGSNYFTSGKVYLDVEFSKMVGKSTLQLFNLNGQNLKQMATDLLRPSIAVFETVVGKKYSIGDKVSTSLAVGLDVLDPYTVTTVSVMNANGEVVTDVNGVKLQNVAANVSWEFKIETYGYYSVVYSVQDSSNKKGSYQYVVSATDDIKPTLTLECRVVESAKVNDTIYVPLAKGTDNVSKNVTIGYYVITPDNVLHYLQRSLYDSFKVTKAGTYTIRYTLMDELGNMLIKDFTVTVK